MNYQLLFECTILTDPKPKGRPRFTRKGFAYTPKETKDYETQLTQAIAKAWNYPYLEERPLIIELTFNLQKPKTSKRDYPIGRPDLDNLAKAVLDSMNKIVYKDDSLICDLILKKRYSSLGYIDLKVKALDCITNQEAPI